MGAFEHKSHMNLPATIVSFGARLAYGPNAAGDRALHMYRRALCASALFQLVHMVALPICITWDGCMYIYLSTLFGTPDFVPAWDFLRGPVYPALIRIGFWILGTHSAALIGINTLLGFGGIWLLGNSIKRQGFPRAAAGAMMLLSFYPILITYQHMLLSEAGIFFCFAALINVTSWQSRHLWWSTTVKILVITFAYYYRSNLIYLGLMVAVLHLLQMASNGTHERWRILLRKIFSWRPIVHAAAVAVIPFILALPWKHLGYLKDPKLMEMRQADVLAVGLFNQLVIHPEDDFIGPDLAPAYTDLVNRSLVNGKLPLDGVGGAVQGIVSHRIGRFMSESGFFDQVRKHPVRYIKGVARTTLIFFGAPGHNLIENKTFLAHLTPDQKNAPAKIYKPPPSLDAQIEERFGQRTGWSVVNRVLLWIDPVYDVLIVLGMLATIAALALGIRRADLRLLTAAALPLGFIAMYALVLLSADRYAFPVYAAALANLFHCTALWLAPERTHS